MTTLSTTNIGTKSVKELREMAKDLNISGRWDLNKAQLVEAITLKLEAKKEEMAAEEAKKQSEKTAAPKKRGRSKKINVLKDGEFLIQIDGLLQTFAWAKENEITNTGWVKRSLKTGEETQAGWRYKNGGGYKFEYAEETTPQV